MSKHIPRTVAYRHTGIPAKAKRVLKRTSVITQTASGLIAVPSRLALLRIIPWSLLVRRGIHSTRTRSKASLSRPTCRFRVQVPSSCLNLRSSFAAILQFGKVEVQFLQAYHISNTRNLSAQFSKVAPRPVFQNASFVKPEGERGPQSLKTFQAM